MRIAIICEAVFPENKGGLERWMVWLASNLNSIGHDVIYLNASSVNGNRSGVNYKALTKKNWNYNLNNTRSIFQSIYFSKNLFMHLRQENYEVVYCAQAPLVSLLFVKLANYRRKKYLFIIEWLEIWSFSYWRNYLGPFLGSLGYLIQYLALIVGEINICFTDRVYKKINKIRSSNKVVKLPGICMEILSNFPSGTKEKSNIFFLARFVKEKNPFFAIDAVIEFQKLGWQGIFFMIGTGPMENKIREYIKINSASRFIKLVVNIEDSEVKNIMKSCFVLIHPSMREGFGLAMIESACHGVPTILVNYPENASVDLAIVNELVSQEFSVSALVDKLDLAFKNQRIYYAQLKRWVETIYPNMLGKESLSTLDNVIKDRKY